VWAGDAKVVLKVGEKGDDSESFSEAHSVGEDAVQTIMMQLNHLVEALHMVSSHLVINES